MAYIKCLRNVISSTVPDGKTVTPTDVIATWLACGSRTEEYTTIGAVLADSTCLNALMASDNAVDYLVRSTTFASDITSDSGAMTAIGLNNYCANTLLGDSTWCEAICNSTYFESVLNVKVPTMTSNTTPSGVVSASSYIGANGGYPWKAFSGSNDNFWMAGSASYPQWLAYTFANAVKIYAYAFRNETSGGHNMVKNYEIFADNVQIGGGLLTDETSGYNVREAVSTPTTGSTFKINLLDSYSTQWMNLRLVQFYGRADV